MAKQSMLDLLIEPLVNVGIERLEDERLKEKFQKAKKRRKKLKRLTPDTRTFKNFKSFKKAEKTNIEERARRLREWSEGEKTLICADDLLNIASAVGTGTSHVDEQTLKAVQQVVTRTMPLSVSLKLDKSDRFRIAI